MANEIVLNFTTLADAGAQAQFAESTPLAPNGGTYAQANNTDYSQRYGTQCVEFTYSAAVTAGGIKLATALTGAARFDLRDNEASAWFINPKFDGDGNELLATADASLRLRVYSSQSGAERYADYYQTQHKNKIDGTYNGGWLYLFASGAAGTEDANGGTWTDADAALIDNIAVIITTQQANSGTSDPAFAVDWFKYYDKISIRGYNTAVAPTEPWNFTDLFLAANVTPGAGPVGIWGTVTALGADLFVISTQLEFGEDPTPVAGAFTDENKFIYMLHSSSDFKLDVTIRDDYQLTFGEKNASGTFTYAQDGCQLFVPEEGFFTRTTPNKCAPAFTVDSGGLFDAYATLIRGFGTVNLGSGNTAQVDDIELIGVDFYDNDEIEFRSTQIEVDNIRIHQDSSDLSDLGAVYAVPTQFDRVQTFNGTTGLTFRVTMTADGFSAGDLTNDFAVLDGEEVTMLSSSFDGSSILRVV